MFLGQENSRLDEYYRDPNIFRLIHRGDIKPFYTRQVSVKHCKPFKGKIDSEQIVDPIMLDRFLNAMGVDSRDDLVSEIDPHRGRGPGSDSDDDPAPRPPRAISPTNSSTASNPSAHTAGSNASSNTSVVSNNTSNSSGNPHNIPQVIPDPDVVMYPMPVPPPLPELQGAVGGRADPVVRLRRPTAIDRLVDNLKISDNAKDMLKGYYKKQNDLDAMSAVAGNYRDRIVDLERQVRNPDPNIRAQAEQQLEAVLDMINDDMAQAQDNNIPELPPSLGSDDSGSYHSGTSLISINTSVASIQPLNLTEGDRMFGDPDFGDQAEMEWDNELEPNQAQDQPQEINIRTPNVNINIRPSIPPRSLRDQRALRRSHSGFTQRDMRQWLETVTPERRLFSPPPVVTRSGRISNPPRRYSESLEEAREEELKELARAMELSRQERREKEARAQTLSLRRRSEPAPSTSRASVPQASTSRGVQVPTGTIPKTTKPSESSRKSKSTKK